MGKFARGLPAPLNLGLGTAYIHSRRKRTGCPQCGARVSHWSSCPIFLQNQPMPKELADQDYSSLSQDQDTLEVLAHAQVSPETRAACEAELRKAERTNWRLR